MSELERVAHGFAESRSVVDIAREAYEDATFEESARDEHVPLFEPRAELHLTFGMLRDYHEVRKAIARTAKRKQRDAAAKELAVAFETLKMASTGGYLLVGDEQYDIVDENREPVTLGLGMHRALFPDGRTDKLNGVLINPTTDNEAIADLFCRVGTLGIMNMGTRVDMWISAGGPSDESDDDADDLLEDVLGES